MKSRSILQLIITAFTLGFVPLIAVVVTAVIQVDHLAERNQNAVLRCRNGCTTKSRIYQNMQPLWKEA